MTHDLLDLGRRAVACPRWRWMSGMATTCGARIVRAYWTGGLTVLSADGASYVVDDVDSDEFPDLSDPATRGCLLALVREAWQDAGVAYCYPVADGWHVVARGRVLAWGTTEAAALVAALEAAP